MTKQYRKNKRRICVVICLVLCMISGIKIQAAQPGYFDNPQTVYDEFAGKIYDKGVGEQKAAFRYSVWDSILRIGGVVALLPRFGME